MVEVILDKSIIHDYGDIHNHVHRKLIQIFYNENHIFILNRQVIQYFNQNVSNDHKEQWELLFTYLSDNNKFFSSQTDTLNSEDIFLENPKKYDFSIILANNQSPSLHVRKCELKSTHISDLLFLELLQFSKMTFRYSNFRDDNEIENLFQKIFTCSKHINKIVIIARFGIVECKIIEFLRNKGNNKEYWTTRKRSSSGIDRTNDLRYLRRHLGVNFECFYGRSEDIHERKIIMGNLILEMDDDFDKISKLYDTWVCNCLVNHETARNLMLKRSRLRKLN